MSPNWWICAYGEFVVYKSKNRFRNRIWISQSYFEIPKPDLRLMCKIALILRQRFSHKVCAMRIAFITSAYNYFSLRGDKLQF